MSRYTVKAVVAGSAPLPVYGGVRIDPSVLEKMAEALRSGRLPMLLQHDIRRPVDAKILDAGVRPTPEGHQEVWVEFDVEAEQWDEFDRERAAAGAPGGFSFSCSEPLARLDALPDAVSTEVIHLAADAHHWTDDQRLAAAEELRRLGPVSVERRYEFAVEPASVVVLTLVLAVLVNLFASVLYDVLKLFLLPPSETAAGRPTIFHFRVQRPEGLVEARLETDDPEALRSAVETLDQIANPGRPAVWNSDLERWETPE